MSNTWLTHQDVENYGPELIDVTQRAALHAIEPKLQLIAQDNAMLRDKLAREQRHRLDAQVERAVPDYQQVDRDPAWHRWLLGIDALSGRVRQVLLDDAISRADANRVKFFFDSFKREAGSASTSTAASRSRRPAPGQSGHVYTRDEIRQLYARRRKGEYTDETFNRIEADIFDAQKTGRISMYDYLTK